MYMYIIMTEEHKAEEASEKEGIYFGKSFACLYQQRTTLCLSGNESSGVLKYFKGLNSQSFINLF